MSRSSAATRMRLMDAAIAEFAEFGLAGARVDRMAAAAEVNKRAIYDYFVNKKSLFDVALAQVIAALTEAVPLRQDDLPGYAGELFDYLFAHPEAVRMIAWRRLERPEAASQLSGAYVHRMMDVRDRSQASTIGPVDLVLLVIGLANAWQLSASDLLSAAEEDPSDARRISQHRDAVVEAARRLGQAP